MLAGANRDSPVSVLCFLQKLDQVTCLQGEVSCFARLIGQLHPETAAVTLQRENDE